MRESGPSPSSCFAGHGRCFHERDAPYSGLQHLRSRHTASAFARLRHREPHRPRSQRLARASGKNYRRMRSGVLHYPSEKRRGLRRIFATPLTIITGPPGSGKRTIAALANVAAAKIYPNAVTPIHGVALAGRAASMLHDAASTSRMEFPAATIHRTLGLELDAGDLDTAVARRNMITAPVLVIDETSMIGSILLAAVLGRTAAEHVVLLGDVDQLPPIGAGAPFADMIAKGIVPVTRLERNYRTDLAGIRGLAGAINGGVVPSVSSFVEKGGVTYQKRANGERGSTAGEIWRDLVKSGTSPHEIAVITPHSIGDEGTAALNRDIRRKLCPRPRRTAGHVASIRRAMALGGPSGLAHGRLDPAAYELGRPAHAPSAANVASRRARRTAQPYGLRQRPRSSVQACRLDPARHGPRKASPAPCPRRQSSEGRQRPRSRRAVSMSPVERTASGPRRQRASIRAAMRGPAVGWFANGLADSRARRAADHRAVLITIPGNARNCSG